MKDILLRIVMLATVLCASTAGFAQQQKIDLGKREFETSCAVCHGVDAKGGGLYTSHLKITPSDLTVLAKKNGGVFPTERIHQIIDGRAQIGVHGPRDMPVWGARYSTAMADVEYIVSPDVRHDPEAYIRSRILVLIDYLYRVQQK